MERSKDRRGGGVFRARGAEGDHLAFGAVEMGSASVRNLMEDLLRSVFSEQGTKALVVGLGATGTVEIGEVTVDDNAFEESSPILNEGPWVVPGNHLSEQPHL